MFWLQYATVLLIFKYNNDFIHLALADFPLKMMIRLKATVKVFNPDGKVNGNPDDFENVHKYEFDNQADSTRVETPGRVFDSLLKPFDPGGQ